MATENDLRALMHDEVTATERPSRVLDVHRAMARGRRERQLRRAAAAALTTLVVAGTAVGIPMVFRTGDPRPPIGTGTTPTPTPTDDATITLAPTRIDPAIQYVSFGWVPEGFREPTYVAGVDETSGEVARIWAIGDPERDELVSAQLFPAGLTPPAPDFGSGVRVRVGPVASDATPVNGHPAQWLAYTQDTLTWEYLQWEYAPGASIRVLVTGFGADARTVAHRVAESLQLSDERSLGLPFHLPGYELRSVTVAQYETSPAPFAFAVFEPHITVSLQTGQTLNAADYPPNTTVDGHPAYESTERLQVYDLDGRSLVIDDPSGGARAIYDALELIPDLGGWHPDLYAR